METYQLVLVLVISVLTLFGAYAAAHRLRKEIREAQKDFDNDTKDQTIYAFYASMGCLSILSLMVVVYFSAVMFCMSLVALIFR